jgi:5-methylcytosine-specific restriction endonuclease McrA
MKRADVFARDEYRCVYCGEVFPPEALSVDHVQPRARGGDHSAGNVVTACGGCNVRKGHRKLADFLAEDPAAREHFFRHARHVWKRHLRAVEEELRARGVVYSGIEERE